MEQDKRFYIYIWYIVPTGEVFYVGKGSGRRYKQIGRKHRNKFFMDMLNSHECDVAVLKDGLTEESAFRLERTLIQYYRLYTKFRLTNQTEGGEGVSGFRWPEEAKAYLHLQTGERNPNYGHKWSDEMKDNLRQKQISSGRYIGAMNPNAKRIQCVESGEIFGCIEDARKAYKVKSPTSFSIALDKANRTAAGLHWISVPS